MFSRPALAILAAVVLEIYALTRIASGLGGLLTLTLLLLCSAVGFFVFRSASAGFLTASANALGQQLQGSGNDADRHRLADQALTLVASVLLILPGLVSAAVGFVLLLPPVRAAVRPLAIARLVPRMTAASPFGGAGFPSGAVFGNVTGFGSAHGPFGARSRSGDVLDVDIVDDAGPSPRPPRVDPELG